MSPAYTVLKISGLWDVFHCGQRVRTFLSEGLARIHCRAWNENRQPLPEEIARAFSEK